MVDSRQVSRDSLFLLANIKVEGQDGVHRVKVRNLSAGGMMAEAPLKVARGIPVSVELRNIGWVDGAVAWKQDSRFGIAFVDEIDPVAVRGTPVVPEAEYEPPRFTRPVQRATPPKPDPKSLRKL